MRFIFLCLALLTTMGLFAKDSSMTARPLHYLSTDKQIYHPGEKVFFRDVVLDGQTNYPLDEFLQLPHGFRWRLLGPQENEVASGMFQYENSVGADVWSIPKDLAGGIYTLKVWGNDGAPAERTFEVRNYRAPRIRTQIDFLKRGYLPGEEITAVIRFQRAEGEALENPRVSAVALLDGEVIYQGEELPVADGVATAKFTLPAEIAEGDGTLNFTILDGGVLESAGKSIPVLLSNYTVEFYPEGGDLVEGAVNRVYIEARQKNGQGADIAGKIVDASGEKVAEFATVFDGRGIAEFTPVKGQGYRLVVPNEVTGTNREFALPAAKSGATISAVKPVYDFAERIVLRIQVSPEGAKQLGYVILRKRDVEIQKVKLGKEQREVELKADEAEGVLVATLYAKDDTPLAERLVFRSPKYRVRTSVEGTDGVFTPGGKVTLTVVTTDDAGTPVSAQVGLTVTDASVYDMVDRRDIAPRLPAMVYLENEVRSFADAGDYFDAADALAPVKIDLLLGTQGWRRFVQVRKEEIASEYSDALLRILAPEVKLFKIEPRSRRVFFGRAAKLGAVEDGAMANDLVFEEAMPLMAMAAAPAGGEENAVMPLPPDFVAGVELKAVGADAQAEADMPMADMAMAEKPAAAPPMMAKRFLREEPVWTYAREYAHQARKDRKPGDRVDFTETIYWAASCKTDPRTGKAEISFELPDTIGAFRVLADSFGGNGALGEYTGELKSVQPFYTEIKLPLFLTAGDEALLPITLVNATKEEMAGVNLVLEAGENLRILEAPKFAAGEVLAAGERRAVFAKVQATAAGEVALTVRAVAGGNADAVTRKVTVLSRLFPFAAAAGARISQENGLVTSVEIPDGVENGSVKVTAQVYSSPAATMEAALNALLRQPHGCFEQTSSTNYPLVMAQQYFLSHAGCDPATIAKAQGLLDEGYKKLVSFECSKKGYEWFGADPGHEALSAYGLMEFADMAKVMPVDQTMVTNTREWLLKRRDGKGGFLRNEQALDSFGRAPAPTTDAYIVWSLLESGQKADTLKAEIEAVAKKAASEEDDYLKALAANILFLAGDADGAKRFADALAKDQKADGTMAHPGPTITCSGSVSQNLECTALAALAWVRCGGKYIANTECAMKMLAESCQAGKFGSTQSTVLVLKAINAYDAAFAKPLSDGTVQLWLDGKPFGAAVPFTKESKGILALPDCGLALTPGKHSLEIRLTGESELSCSVQVEGMTVMPTNAGSVTLSTELSKQEVTEGEPVQLMVKVTNTADAEAQMPLAVIAIPGGLEPRAEQLKELKEAGRIAAYEVQDNAVVLYWRGLASKQTAQVPLALTAAIPGEYTAAASRAYLYYDDQAKQYQPGVAAKIAPKER